MSGLFCGAVFAMTLSQARYVADNSSKYSVCQVHAAVEMLTPAETRLPDNPSDEFIASNASRYSIFEVHAAVERIRARRSTR